MYLSNGNTYVPGEGRTRAMELRDQEMPPEVVAHYVDEARDSIRRYGRVPGGTMDLFVADLIVRGIITHRQVALTLLDQGMGK
jgi:predicted HAD superfamily phosphohydrolase